MNNKHKKMWLGALMTLGTIASTALHAAVTESEAARLGKDLTPLGGEMGANKDGSIPAWKGGYTSVPAGYKSGEPRLDPFAAEKPLYVVTAKNMDQYSEQLSDGVKALLKKFPGYRVDVYPTQRTAAAPAWYYENTQRNATRAKTTHKGLSIEGACGGVPFPIPKDGYEVMWNHLLSWKGEASKMHFRSYVVNGGKAVMAGDAVNDENRPYAFKTSCGKFNGNYWELLQTTMGPPFKAGETILLRDPIDQVDKGRQAWQYLVGQRRVRRAPTIAYDTPDSVNSGSNYFDEAFIFLGALDRFQWKLVGKKEMLIPYNNNGLWLKKTEAVLGENHLNPDAVRWEKHRVWVVEATLAQGNRNVIPKRRFYIDEDNWVAALYDGWDAQGQLWHSGFGFSNIIFELPGTVLQSFSIYNHLGNSYNLVAIPNGQDYHFKQVTPLPDNYFTPENLAGQGTR
ncbi:MAG: DUF1329 domain-containing protein [Pseudomonadota bacterium]